MNFSFIWINCNQKILLTNTRTSFVPVGAGKFRWGVVPMPVSNHLCRCRPSSAVAKRPVIEPCQDHKNNLNPIKIFFHIFIYFIGHELTIETSPKFGVKIIENLEIIQFILGMKKIVSIFSYLIS